MKNSRLTYAALTLVSLLLCSTVFAEQIEPPAKGDYKLGRAAVVNRVILSVIESYYDPLRIDPQEMFEVTMSALEKSVAELIVINDEEKKTAQVIMPSARISINLNDLNSPWSLSRKIREVFRFLQKNLPSNEYNFRDLEYGAANALLSTLDPHSNALPPAIYEDLRMGTAGEFGGLGIKITTDRRPPCKGTLTVVQVFDGTPAKREGLKPGDEIVRIAGESTLNITTSEAASRLRGKPGTKVKIDIKRGGKVRTYDIMRQSIPLDSVQWEMLEENVGYIYLEAFQGNSEIEFKQALLKLHEKGMKGLILDLRGNPGGLLSVAIEIADYFLDSGTIVATAGRSEDDRSVRNANALGTEPQYPLIVLIDAYSASAAEILAGALHNHGRALLVGDTTFGKGSVQMVMPILGGGALKLTSAQYLTPGNISIQAVGVSPDVLFIPSTVEKKDMDIIPNGLRFSEADLEHHLDRPNIRSRNNVDALNATLFIPVAEKRADEQRYERCFIDEPTKRPFRDRYEKEFARRLIVASPDATTGELKIQAKKMLAEEDNKNGRLLSRALKKIGIDWSASDDKTSDTKDAKPDTRVTTKVELLDDVIPGKELRLKVTVKNETEEFIHRLHGVTKSDNGALDGHELIFGKIKPFKKKSWTTTIEMPNTLAGRIDPVSIAFKADDGPVPPSAKVNVSVPKRPRPTLAYSWQIIDPDNNNGVIQADEILLLHLTVKNIGDLAISNAVANLAAKPGVNVVRGRFNVDKLLPGQVVDGDFELKVAPGFTSGTAELMLSVEEWMEAKYPLSRTLLHRKIELNVSKSGVKADSAAGTITITKAAKLLQAPSKSARSVATVKEGTSFKVNARLGEYFHLVLGEDYFAWVHSSKTKPGGKARPQFEPIFIAPPSIEIVGSNVRQVGVDKITLKGKASHATAIRDVMVFVGDNKVLYQPNKNKDSKTLEFEVEIPLEEGANYVAVIARHDDKLMATTPVFIRRDKKE